MCKLLIVENDKSWSRFLVNRLSAKDVEIVCAFDGKEAVDRLNSNDIDFAIIDVVVPKISGVGITELIRKKKLKTKVAFIISTYEEGDKISDFLIFMSKDKRQPVKQVFFKNGNFNDSDIINKCKSFIQESVL